MQKNVSCLRSAVSCVLVKPMLSEVKNDKIFHVSLFTDFIWLSWSIVCHLLYCSWLIITFGPLSQKGDIVSKVLCSLMYRLVITGGCELLLFVAPILVVVVYYATTVMGHNVCFPTDWFVDWLIDWLINELIHQALLLLFLDSWDGAVGTAGRRLWCRCYCCTWSDSRWTSKSC